MLGNWSNTLSIAVSGTMAVAGAAASPMAVPLTSVGNVAWHRPAPSPLAARAVAGLTTGVPRQQQQQRRRQHEWRRNQALAFGTAAGVSLGCFGSHLLSPRRRGIWQHRRRCGALQAYSDDAFRMRKLGSSELLVPDVCLGTMTWGRQNTEEEAHAQLDYAVKDRGLKFMDTAELYPVPAQSETQGATERYIGSWLAKSGVPRDELVIASKVCGHSPMDWFREAGAPTRVNADQVREGVEKSLTRLGTDHLDLLQIHWPDRYVSLFGGDSYDESNQREGDVPFEEQLKVCKELHEEGKVRYFGVSNETTFGVASFINASEQLGLPRMVSIQNSYSLLVRTQYETDLAEACCKRNYNVGLLAYSPLAGGVLTGKYLVDEPPSEARLNLFKGYMARYRNSASEEATREYVAVAHKYGLTPTQLALGWCKSRWFVTSSIIGATSVEQLKENIDAFSIDLSDETLDDIAGVFKRFRDPTMNPVPPKKDAEEEQK